MDDVVLMEVGEGLEDLPANFFDIFIGEFFFMLEHLTQISFGVLGNNDDFMFGLDHFKQFNDMLMAYFFEDIVFVPDIPDLTLLPPSTNN